MIREMIHSILLAELSAARFVKTLLEEQFEDNDYIHVHSVELVRAEKDAYDNAVGVFSVITKSNLDVELSAESHKDIFRDGMNRLDYKIHNQSTNIVPMSDIRESGIFRHTFRIRFDVVKDDNLLLLTFDEIEEMTGFAVYNIEDTPATITHKDALYDRIHTDEDACTATYRLVPTKAINE